MSNKMLSYLPWQQYFENETDDAFMYLEKSVFLSGNVAQLRDRYFLQVLYFSLSNDRSIRKSFSKE